MSIDLCLEQRFQHEPTLFLRASILEISVDHLNFAHSCFLFELEPRMSNFLATCPRRSKVVPMEETISFTMRTRSSPARTNVDSGSLISSWRIVRELERIAISPTSN